MTKKLKKQKKKCIFDGGNCQHCIELGVEEERARILKMINNNINKGHKRKWTRRFCSACSVLNKLKAKIREVRIKA
jgi:hypothetical protein